MVIKIVSGGQTGVDRAALDVALENDIACGGWCPKGRRAEDGVIDKKYPLVESETTSNAKRTEANVRDSDGTLILTWGNMSGGTLSTAAVAGRLKKPLLVVKMAEPPTMEAIEAWVTRYLIRVLNVAGPRASEQPNAYDEAKVFLKALLIGDETAEEAEIPVEP